ncbi:Myosin-binding protein 3 [Heracleum sosnowskyi]|uniref:Myosin-binding protein 3 n=1 Tax=Heracleum sosnowskyi TaxID=360622 RepID=A0AAD8MVX5_9APIA|nr:Myosin-binding protein 3 [Heracleum sosnowskyi]
MAANKFASMVHRNTNKLTLILVYVLLEWTLIALLLLNSLLSYFIIKFANYFGLKPPCFMCSRIDHFFEPEKGDNFNKDLVCEAHATEISQLGYCKNHQKLATFRNMCEDCSFSRPDFCGVSKNFSFLPWVKEIGMIGDDDDDSKVFDDGVLSLRCSCCDVSLEKQVYSPYVLIKPSWGDLKGDHKENFSKKEEFSDRIGSEFLVDHLEDDYEVVGKNEGEMICGGNGGYSLIQGKADEDSDSSISVSKFGLEELKGGDDGEVEMLLEKDREFFKEDLNEVMKDLVSDEIMRKDEASSKIHPEDLEFFIDFSGHQLVPIELIDSTTEEIELNKAEENRKTSDLQENNCSSEFVIVDQVETVVEENKFADFESMDIEETENSLVFNAKESFLEYENADNSRGMEEIENFLPFNAKESVLEYENADNSRGMEEIENFLPFNAKESVLEYENADKSVEMDHSRATESYAEHSNVGITQAPENTFVDFNDVQGIAALEGQESESNVPADVFQVQSKESELEVLVGTKTAALDAEEVESYVPAVSEEDSPIIVNETELEVSIGTEIPELYPTDETQAQDTTSSHEDPSSSSANFHEDDHEHGIEIKLQQEETLRLGNLAIEISENMTNNQLSASTESDGIDEEKIPDTPTSLDNFHHLHKKFLLDRKESGTEESLDGSVLSEFESGDGVITVERLTSALKAERKALHVVYTELEEERSASAVAANQTMAMINRLQEEKAAMQMEALQYQRMMEEQSEYDQEALQLLNELMLKREREKQELEKELDMYRKKVTDYEAKEKMRMLRRSKDGSARSAFSSASFSNREDSDDISTDFNQEVEEEDGFYSHQESGNHNTPVDAVIHLGESFGEFEEERMSILEQLKVLEDKLFTLSEDEHQYEHVRPIKHFSQGNGNHLDENSDFSGEECNGFTNGYPKEMNGKHHQEGRYMGAKAKRLLPLFDATTAENENDELNGHENGHEMGELNGHEYGELNGHENGFESVVTRFELEERRVAIEEEVDQLYARMHALETDKEFLKHCISSLKKGDKGIDLLQEILQHLRDLRNMELRAKEFTDGTPLV